MAAVVRPRFFAHFALFFAAFVFIAFSRTYYLRFLSDQPPMTTLMHLHGLVSTAWVLLFIAQTRLVAANRVDLHMKLGLAGVGLAVVMTAIGLMTMAAAGNLPGLRPTGLTHKQFTATPLVTTVSFAVLFSLAVALRRRSDLHKRLMVLAMIAIAGPAIGRLAFTLDAVRWLPYFNPAVVLAMVAACLAFDWKRHRIVHPVFVWGGAALVLSWPFRYWLARSDVYVPLSEWIARAGS